MRVSKKKGNLAVETEVYENFLRLDREHRRRIAVRILRNQKILSDLYDHFLIQRSLSEPGQDTVWESYARGNGSGR